MKENGMRRLHVRAGPLWAFLALLPLLGLGCRGGGVPPPADPEIDPGEAL